MKKILFTLVLVVAFVFFAGGYAAARSVEPGYCDSEDLSYFPFGFMCGSAPTLQSVVIGLDPGNSSDTIQPGTALSFNTFYDVKNTVAGRPALVWVYVDGPTNLTDSSRFSYSNPAGDTSKDCPGTGASNTGRVFGTYGQGTSNNSPVGFDNKGTATTSDDTGVVDCGSDGGMIFWNNAPTSPGVHRNFATYQLPSTSEGNNLCFRMIVSLKRSAGEQTFPSPGGGYGVLQGVGAEQIVKQSERKCYNVQNSDPTGEFEIINNCNVTTFKVKNVNDQGRRNLIFKLYGVTAGGTPYPIGFNGSPAETAMAQANGSGNASGYADFAVGQGYRLYVSDPDIAWGPGINPYRHVASAVTPGGSSCVDNRPTYSVHVTCDGVYLNDVDDINIRGGAYGNGVRIFAKFWHKNGDNSFSEVNGQTNPLAAGYNDYDADDRRDTFIAWPWGSTNFNGAGNTGWSMWIGDYNVNGSGGDDAPRYRHAVNVGNGCYQASCSLDVQEPAGFPANGVKAGEQFSVAASVSNPTANAYTDVHVNSNYYVGGWTPINWTLPPGNVSSAPNNALGDTLGGGQLSLSDGGGDSYNTGGVGGIDVLPSDNGSWSIPRSESRTKTFTLTAPNIKGTTTLSVYPDYANVLGLGSGCDAGTATTITVYQPFSVSLGTSTVLDPTIEDPAKVWYNSWLENSSGHTVDLVMNSSFTKNGANIVPPASGGTYASSGRFNILPRPPAAVPGEHTTAPIKNAAGDRWCTNISLTYTAGWVGPGGSADLAGTNTPGNSSTCPVVKNEPLFKVNNGSVWSGGTFKPTSTADESSCNSGGSLGGWYNRGGYPDYEFGSGSELSALALVKITGFASARTAPDRSATDLTFANNDNAHISNHADSPELGGYFGGGHCLADVQPSPTSRQLTGNQIIDTNSGIAADNKLRTDGHLRPLPNRDIALGRQAAYFVDGDVYIKNNIVYAPGATYNPTTGKTTMPSFVLVATGSIYIDPGVTQLDGVYIAKKRIAASPPSKTNGGVIYTCATWYGTPVSNYGTCKNQLTVNGSFIANKLSLLRTYGSLRDEKPKVNAARNELRNQSVRLYRYDGCAGGAHNYRAAATNTPNTPPAAPPGCEYEGPLSGAILPTQSNGTTVAVTMQVTPTQSTPLLGYAFAPQSGSCPVAANPLAAGGSVNVQTVPVYKITAGGPPYTPSYSYLYSQYPGDEGATGPRSNGTTSSSGWPSQLVFCVYPQHNQGGGVVALPESIDPPDLPLSCSAAAGAIALSTWTCAAEVFNYTPELYLNDPNIKKGDKSAPEFDAMTSLPPVL